MKKLSVFAAAAVPMLTFAHSGHGVVDSGLSHYILSPMHLVGALAAVIIGFGVYKLYKSSRSRNA